jgi:hypothetical protein
MKKYILVLAVMAFLTWGYSAMGYEWSGILMGLLLGYLLGTFFE